MASFTQLPRVIQEVIAKAYQELIDQGVVITIPSELPKPPTPPASDAYALSATRAYPAASTYTFEPKALVVRTSVPAFNTGAQTYTITGRYINTPGPEGWLVDLYMPGGEIIIFDRCVFATPTNGDMTHITDHSRVRFRNCIFLGTGNQAAGVLRARAIFAEQGRLIDVQNCYFGNTAGCKLNNWSANVTSDSDTVTWKYNRYDNICGGNGEGGGPYCQALQLQHIIRPGIEVAHNQVDNTPGASRVEDCFNWGESGGTSASPLRFHHNYVRGAKPANPKAKTDNNGNYTGTGTTTDGAGNQVPASKQPQYILGEYNWFVGTMNAAMNIAAGHHITYQKNIIVVSGFLADGTREPAVNNAIGLFNNSGYSNEQFNNNKIIDNLVRYNSANGENAFYNNGDLGPGSVPISASNNTLIDGATFKDELDTFTAWQKYLKDNKITVGVAPKA